MSAVFTPHPLLARSAPTPGAGFGAAQLLTPVQVSFQPDPVLSRTVEPVPAPGQAAAFIEARPNDHALAQGPSTGTVDAAAHATGVDQGAEFAALESAADGSSPRLGQGALGEDALNPESAGGPAVQAALEQRYRDGFEDGLAQGARLAAEDAAAADRAAEGASAAAAGDALLMLESLSRALAPLLLPDDAAARFEPLKRLALHLAMELVRTELSVSPRAVEHLVKASVQALQASDEAPLVVELNPRDLAVMKELLAGPARDSGADPILWQRVKWVEDAELPRGSVRARSDVSCVEDLIQQRLASIIQDLRIQAVQWQRDEVALQQSLEAATPEVNATGDDDAGLR
jgi:flagellar biosynthesis/type III secretory pathway protein FliH